MKKILLFTLLLVIGVISCSKKDSQPEPEIKALPLSINTIVGYFGKRLDSNIFNATVKTYYRNNNIEYDLNIRDANAPIKENIRLSISTPDDDSRVVDNIIVGPIAGDKNTLIKQARYFEENFSLYPILFRGYSTGGHPNSKYYGSRDEFYNFIRDNKSYSGYVFYEVGVNGGNYCVINVTEHGLWFLIQPPKAMSQPPFLFE